MTKKHVIYTKKNNKIKFKDSITVEKIGFKNIEKIKKVTTQVVENGKISIITTKKQSLLNVISVKIGKVTNTLDYLFFKTYINTNKSIGITDLCLTISVITSDYRNEQEIFNAMENERTKKVIQWKNQNIGKTLLARRREVIKKIGCKKK